MATTMSDGLRKLGWSEELIQAFERARRHPTVAAPPPSDRKRVTDSTAVFISLQKPTSDRSVVVHTDGDPS